ncbi:GNAT family N-acetyltransferase [Noviherbaspirillum cavernae]|uniref:GNAT family N-acetyltransferase n=2 Tax=Noviherbaspirillum cavernae TaxID=2320862 RepID=A0A418X6S8_9BURK|nr:GNAT family N-acetyltransferase [Noviherbaspirillum cavernae]
MQESDIPCLLFIQSECYAAEMVEDEATIRARFCAAPAFAWVAEDAAGVCAYFVGYPSELGKVTPLGSVFSVSPAPTSMYFHDLAVARRTAGKGVGSALARFALEAAALRGFRHSSLVSVQGSAVFWRALGYEDWHGLDAAQTGNLATYAQPARYMVKALN